MGCAGSKQRTVCRNCGSPMRRSYSIHVHHPPQHDGDTYHVVSLTSTTLGSFNQNHRIINEPNPPIQIEIEHEKRSKDISVGAIEAREWSRMIDEKLRSNIAVVLKTPIRTPPEEPETIDAWELMEGLEESSPNSISIPSPFDQSISKLQDNGEASPKRLSIEMGEGDGDSNSNSNSNANAISGITDSNPDVITTFRKSLEDLPFLLQSETESEFTVKAVAGNNEQLKIKDAIELNGYKFSPATKDKLVVYFTSLRGVRKTYEDCCHVRVILKGSGVRVDERDVSMHSGFKEELRELLGDGFVSRGGGGLPRVFAGRKLVGGAEEIRQMHEEGRLEKVLQGCEMVDEAGGGGGAGEVCVGCGDIRFVPCDTCSGSCKVYCGGDYNDEEYDESECRFQRCPHCNENGLIRCPICCD